MAHKSKHRPRHNERKRKSFESRYGMTRAEFRNLNGKEKSDLQQKAYQRFIRTA